MTRCASCDGRRVSLRHFMDHPDHEMMISNVTPEVRKEVEKRINNQRMYGHLRPKDEVSKSEDNYDSSNIRNDHTANHRLWWLAAAFVLGIGISIFIPKKEEPPINQEPDDFWDEPWQ